MNKMREIRVAKLTLNIGAGKDAKLLEKGIKLIEELTGVTPVKTKTQKRIPGWGLRPGLPIGCKLTLRGAKALEMIPRLLFARGNVLSIKNFDANGNMSFGIPEYIDIKGAKYNPDIGIIGLQACVTLERPGFRVKRRKVRPSPIPKNHRITKEEAVKFMESAFGTRVEE